MLKSDLAKIFVFTFAYCFGSSLGPGIFMYVAEILPDMGVGVVTLSNWIEVLIIGLLFPILADPAVIGAGWIFMFIAFISFFGIIFI